MIRTESTQPVTVSMCRLKMHLIAIDLNWKLFPWRVAVVLLRHFLSFPPGSKGCLRLTRYNLQYEIIEIFECSSRHVSIYDTGLTSKGCYLVSLNPSFDSYLGSWLFLVTYINLYEMVINPPVCSFECQGHCNVSTLVFVKISNSTYSASKHETL